MARKWSNTRKDEVGAFPLESRMEKVRKYLYEGRRFETLSVGELRSEWIHELDCAAFSRELDGCPFGSVDARVAVVAEDRQPLDVIRYGDGIQARSTRCCGRMP
jgi:hypothetical protein